MGCFSKYRKQIVLLLDMLILIFCSIAIFYLSPQGNGTGGRNIIPAIPNLALLFACIFVTQIVFKSYNTLWRYAESREYLILLGGIGSGALLFFILTQTIAQRGISYLYTLSVITSSVVTMLLMRFAYRAYRKHVIHTSNKEKRRVIIIGAGNAGVAICDEIMSNAESPYKITYFFDDDSSKINRRINGIEVKGPIESIPSVISSSKMPIDEIIIAIPTVSKERKREIVDICNSVRVRAKILPSTLGHISKNTQELVSNIRNVRIEDLLGREQVALDTDSIHNFIKNQVVLVTGGGGSIGSELCRQIASVGPKKLVILDIYENNAYDLQQELRAQYGDELDLSVEIASVRDAEKMNVIFNTYKPQIVFHAAAHKHVPLMESCPEEAVKNNVFGTWNTIQAADRAGVSRFVLISTDKAVNPTNIMGATKYICEMLLRSMHESKTEFVAVRFGNVLGSNGSVIPLFKKQIENGGPITITDKRIIRYFMTISEAAQLVLQAGAMAKKAQLFVLDMGTPVKILTLAENLISLSGLRPYKDIQISEVGLRPGEKLFEELLVNPEVLEKTANEKIFVEMQKPIEKEWMEEQLSKIETVLKNGDKDKLRELLHQIVPSFLEAEEVNANAVEQGTIKE